MKLKKTIFFFFLGLSILFLIVSILSWNLILGACSAVIAIGLTRFLDDVGITAKYTGSEVKKEIKEVCKQKRLRKPEYEAKEGM